MHIDSILNQDRRDFTAVFICEHCGFKEERNGYDDSFYHNVVIPNIPCPQCGKKADSSYRPLATKYPDSMDV